MSNHPIYRKPLLSAMLGKKLVTSVEVREINFKPGQETGRHKHPCPVFGYIADGTAVFQIEGEPEQELRPGSAFYEPADTIIARFDNASPTAEMKFVAYYLLDGQQELIHMLPTKQAPPA
jgi:quercetin dioxygenase-like cupin family protein